MTAIDLASMERVADIADAADRLMLADAYADAGHDGMAEVLRGGHIYRAHRVMFDAGEVERRAAGHDWDEQALEATSADGVCGFGGRNREYLCWGAAESVMDEDARVESYDDVWGVQDNACPPLERLSKAGREGFMNQCRANRWDHYGGMSIIATSPAGLLSALREAFEAARIWGEDANDD